MRGERKLVMSEFGPATDIYPTQIPTDHPTLDSLEHAANSIALHRRRVKPNDVVSGRGVCASQPPFAQLSSAFDYFGKPEDISISCTT